MFVLHGAPALSEFRIKKLQQDLASAEIPTRGIATQFIHVVELVAGAELTATEQSVLEKLLTYGPHREKHTPTGLLQIVAPRPGTISPWSSKATDIAHICGLAKIKRIERAIAYWLEVDNTELHKPLYVLSEAQLATLHTRLHDRMTQAVFND